MGKGKRRVHCSLAHAHTLSGVVVIALFRAGIMPSRGLGTFNKIFSAHTLATQCVSSYRYAKWQSRSVSHHLINHVRKITALL